MKKKEILHKLTFDEKLLCTRHLTGVILLYLTQLNKLELSLFNYFLRDKHLENYKPKNQI